MMAGLVPFDKRKGGFPDVDFNGFDDAFEDFFKGRWPLMRGLSKGSFRLDVQENDKDYLVEAELPGVKKEEVKMLLDDGRLSISVEREENVDEEKKNYVHKERHYSSMSRSVYLPGAKTVGIKAKMEGGILSITVPKEEKADTSYKIDIE